MTTDFKAELFAQGWSWRGGAWSNPTVPGSRYITSSTGDVLRITPETVHLLSREDVERGPVKK